MIIGLDMGGTHVDGVIIKDKKVIKTIKKPTNRDDLFDSIWTSLKELLSDYDSSDIKRINLSTTISTNAIVENKISKVGMIIQSGPGLGTDLLACGDENVFISGYADHRGIVVDELDLVEIQRAKKLFKEKNIRACGLVSKFSTRNPNHELKIRDLLGEDFSPVTLGHRMSGNLNFPRRVYTSYLNSAVHDTFKDFADNIKLSLEKENIKAPVFILKADGGTMDINSAEKLPVETILSGPAASFMGINAMMDDKKEDGILLDIGGTTTDIFFLADGLPLFEPRGAKISDYNTLVRAIYSVSIGLGGDSSIDIENKELLIGPERKGKPYAFGGPKPTPTDAMIFLDLIPTDEASKNKAEKAMKLLGKDLNLSPSETSHLIFEKMADLIKNKTDELLEKINSKPVYTVKEVLDGKKIKAKSINIIGGPANVLAPILEDKYNLPTHFPKNYQVANAIGAALAKPTLELNMSADTSKGSLSVPELGIYEEIGQDYSLEKGKARIMELLKVAGKSIGAKEDTIESEIIEANSYNMVRGPYSSGKNIRIKGQIKPGHIFKLRSDSNES